MKDTIWLVLNKSGIVRTRKTKVGGTDLRTGEIPAKITVQVDNSNWETPTIEKTVRVESWNDDLHVQDVDFKETAITEEEAEMIRERRIENMKDLLRRNGYEVTKIDGDLQ